MSGQAEYVSERVAIRRTEDEVTVYIKASSSQDRKKLQWLKIWSLAWTLVGLLIISQFFFPYDGQEKLFFAIYLSFWAYFEYRVVYAYYFRQYGTETVYIQNRRLMLRRDIYTKKGKAQYYQINEANPFHMAEDKPGSLAKSYYSSFWVIQGGSIAFGEKPREYRFGLQLSEKEAKTVIKVLNQATQVKAAKD